MTTEPRWWLRCDDCGETIEARKISPDQDIFHQHDDGVWGNMIQFTTEASA